MASIKTFWDYEEPTRRSSPRMVKVGRTFTAVYNIPCNSVNDLLPAKGAVMGGWTSGATVTGVYDAAAYTTLTANTANTFYPEMVGWWCHIADVAGYFEIVSLTSGTIVVLSGNATCAGKALNFLLVPRVLNIQFGKKADGKQEVIITFLQPLPYIGG